MKHVRSSALLAAFGILSLAGCGESIPMGTVEGQLMIRGKPANKVKVEFVPDVGFEGPSSTGMTDEAGNFKLDTVEPDGNSRAGAVVGEHRVLLFDIQRAESPTGVGVPKRFSTDYSRASTTPLRQTVTEGPQSITIEVP